MKKNGKDEGASGEKSFGRSEKSFGHSEKSFGRKDGKLRRYYPKLINVRMTEEEYDELVEYAKMKNLSLSEVMRRAVRMYFFHVKTQKKVGKSPKMWPKIS